MSDRQVTVDGQTRPLGPPFLVAATQNPYEFEGTYPLPESQLDRFLMRLRIGYPDRAAEREVLTEHRRGEPVDTLQPVLSGSEVVALQQAVAHGARGRQPQRLPPRCGDGHANPPGHLSRRQHPRRPGLYRAAQAKALLEGRDYVVPDDIKELAPPVLSHRILAKGFRQGERGDAAGQVLAEILRRTTMPV